MTFSEYFSEHSKIYICDHKVPEPAHQSRFFSTLVSGVQSSSKNKYYGDLDGVNLSHNNSLSEMRHQHHVWRHPPRHAKYIGFEHYRRSFFIDFVPSALTSGDRMDLELRLRFAKNDRDCLHTMTEENFTKYIVKRSNLCEQYPEIYRNWIESFDIVLPRPLFDESIKQQWSWTHISQYWDDFVSSIKELSYFHNNVNFVDFDMMRPSFFNMYIMRWNLFDEYMTFWSECADRLSKKIQDEPRILGHFSERLINIFVFQKQIEFPALRVLKLPVLYRE